MARARSLKPGLFKNEVLGIADPIYTIAFQGLWVLADREGRLEDRPLRIKAEILPYREGIKIDDILNWLHENEFIIRYEIKNKKFIQINNFSKHQNPHCKEAASEIPAPDLNNASTLLGCNETENNSKNFQAYENKEENYNTIQAQCKHGSSTVQKLLTPLTLNPEPLTLNPEHSKYAFCGDVIKLSDKDFKEWKSLYPHIDLLYELKRLDLEFNHLRPKNWFVTASQKLNYQNKLSKSNIPKINQFGTKPSNPAGFVVVNG